MIQDANSINNLLSQVQHDPSLITKMLDQIENVSVLTLENIDDVKQQW